MAFENKIKSWVSLDNQIKLLNERARSLREERSKLGENIFEYVETENLSDATVQISDGRLKFISITQTAPLTLTFLKTCLSDCIKNTEDVNSIMTYIKNSRHKKACQKLKEAIQIIKNNNIPGYIIYAYIF